MNNGCSFCGNFCGLVKLQKFVVNLPKDYPTELLEFIKEGFDSREIFKPWVINSDTKVSTIDMVACHNCIKESKEYNNRNKQVICEN